MKPPENAPQTYLGDGLYAWFDGWHIWLGTERDGRWESVALEPRVFRELMRFAGGVLRYEEPT